MTRLSIIALALSILATPVAAAAAAPDLDAQARGRGAARDEGERRIGLAEAISVAASGRSGRHLNASDRGSVIVVRWDYGDGRIADISVDARTGRIVGER